MRPYLLSFGLGLGLNLLFGVHRFGMVLHDGLIDPDSYMRLLRIEQGLAHGGLTNMVLRDDSGAPLLVEWSRLFDAALLALAAPLAPLLGWHRALFAAGVASGPISAGLLGMSLAFAAAPLSERRFLWTAPVIGTLLPGIWGYASFGVVHYHIIMLAAVAATAGFALRARDGNRPMALAAGIAGGIAIWIMPETMPFVLLAWIGLGWRWLFLPIGPALTCLGAGFAGVLALALAIDPPAGGVFAREIDRLSIIYAMLGLAVFGVTLLLARLDRSAMTPKRRTSIGVLGALAGFGLWLGHYPRVALGPYALVSPEDMRRFFGVMAETQPVQDISGVALYLGPGAAALAYGLYRAWRARGALPMQGGWLMMASAAALATMLTARFVIFQQFPAGLAASMLPVALTEASRRWLHRPVQAAAARICLTGFLLLAPYAPAVALAAAHPLEPQPEPASCAMRRIAPLLAPAAGRIVLTDVEDVPELLYRTRIIAVGSLYQHGIAGFLRARAAWRARVGHDPSPALLASGARFVLFCPASKRDALVRTAPPDTLWDALAAGKPPLWLRKTGADPASGFRLYRVIDPAGQPETAEAIAAARSAVFARPPRSAVRGEAGSASVDSIARRIAPAASASPR